MRTVLVEIFKLIFKSSKAGDKSHVTTFDFEHILLTRPMTFNLNFVAHKFTLNLDVI